jgi:hypothetical protein
MLGIPVGFVVANAVEWIFHKYILHGLGKKKNSVWSQHWHVHHRTARKNNMVDEDYKRPIIDMLDSYEFKAVFGGGLIVLPLVTKFPWFVTTVWICGAAYYIIHRQSHLDSSWAKKWVPWHHQHHCGKNQDKNWNITVPLMDYVMGTRQIDVAVP